MRAEKSRPLPCPFCGATPAPRIYTRHPTNYLPAIACPECGAVGPENMRAPVGTERLALLRVARCLWTARKADRTAERNERSFRACPFCGRDLQVHFAIWCDEKIHIQCGDCGALGPVVWTGRDAIFHEARDRAEVMRR